ncbi:InlB B-repeat-containing protein, partial [Butyrivibrio sp. VCD2006]|uniref:InlB B-repeat-containing protein n=1 Tax=Butyrivibrio sp. VCD2006 TaxID=1280664 RepID=UPI00056327E2
MRKNFASKLAAFLTLVVLFTTIGSDYNSIGVRATTDVDAFEQVDLNENNETEESDIWEPQGAELEGQAEEVVEEQSEIQEEAMPVEEPQVEEPSVEEPQVEESQEENVQTEETVQETSEEQQAETTSEETSAAETPAADTPSEDAAPAEETPAEDAAPADEVPAEETPAEEIPAEETPAEEIPEEAADKTPVDEADAPAEVRNVTVTYVATKGGKVSRDSETIDINAEGAVFEGATAEARNDKYEFVNWTDASGNEVSTEATFVPSNIEEDTTFTANFKAAEDIAVEMPALSVSDVHAGGMIVSVSAEEGVFPDGTEVSITGISDAQAFETAKDELGGDVKAAKGVDITFNYKGNEIQPADDRYVHVSLKLDEALEGDTFKVLHDHDGEVEQISANIETEEANSDPQDDTKVATEVSFDSNQFSVYIVVSEETVDNDSRLNVKFMNGSTELASVFVKKSDLEAGTDGVNHFNDIIYDPGVGTLGENVMFRGWTQNADYTTETPELDIDGVRSEISAKLNEGVAEGESVTYYAMLFKAYTVSYLDDRNASMGSSEIKFRADNSDDYQNYTVDMNYTPSDEEHNFEGWFVSVGTDNIEGYDPSANNNKGTLYQNGNNIRIKGNVVFSVNAPEGHWLVFDENGKGATYNAPQFVKSGSVTQAPCDDADMVRLGYTFGGWYDSKENANAHAENPSVTTGEFSFGNTISEKTTVYASWIPTTNANYTVLIWKQNIDGDGYDFVKALTLSGRVGSAINAVSSGGSGNNAYAIINGENYDKYTGFHYASNDQSGKTIAPEGTTVVNVYYDRNQHKLTFQVYVSGTYVISEGDNDDDPEKYGLINGSYTRVYWHNGQFCTRSGSWLFGYNYTAYYGTVYTYGGWVTIKEITALYGQSISDQFPIVGTDGVTYTAARWKPQSSSTYNQVLSYIDIMPNEDVTFHKDNGGPGSGSYKTINYYVEALPGETGQTVTYDNIKFVLYKSLQCNYYFFTEAEDYIELPGFTKCGHDPATGAWGSGGASTVNCYYTRNDYPINFMDGSYFDGNGNRIESETSSGQISVESNISYQGDVSSYNEFRPAITPTGYVFEGWYVDSACTKEFTFKKMPEGGITVYAKWRQIQYRVFLHPMVEATDTTLDWGEGQEMNFRVSYGGKVSTPTGRRAGYEFAGWYRDPEYKLSFNKDAFVLNDITVTATYDKSVDFTEGMDKWGNGATANGDLDRFWITRKLDLYAKWRSTLTGATGIGIIYDANGGSPAPSDTNLYADKAMAAAGAAPTTTPAITENGTTYESRFSHWVVQKWDGSKYVDTEESVTVLPGATFEVKKSDARVKDEEGQTASGDQKKSYTIQLRAEYVKVEKSTPTHITWYNNYDGGFYRQDKNLGVNESVLVYGLGENESIPAREGYKFKGWARDEESVGSMTQSTTLFISYDTETVYNHDKVAADEKAPYHALYAVWEKLYKVSYEPESTAKGSVSNSEDKNLDPHETAGITGSTAQPVAGYIFDAWYKGETKVSEDAALTLDALKDYLEKDADGLYADTSFTAKFVENPEAKYTVTYKSESAAKGSVTNSSDADIQKLGTEGITGSTAQPATGYKFEGWYKGETKVSAEAVLDADTVIANLNTDNDNLYDDTEFEARFEADPDQTYTVTYVADPATMGD